MRAEKALSDDAAPHIDSPGVCARLGMRGTEIAMKTKGRTQPQGVTARMANEGVRKAHDFGILEEIGR